MFRAVFYELNEVGSMMELLSPAGSRDSLTAAVQCGADAVYFGGSKFNARRNANNFDEFGMVNALDYCRVRGVRTYITLNTMLFDRELYEALDYAAFLYEHGADALIVQDVGLISLIHSQLPEMRLHSSTQLGVHDVNGTKAVKRMGMSMAVLSREVGLKDIRYIRDNADIPLEVFAHGALCMSFSGACLFSSMAGERSGNRGTCAQPCRKRIAVDSAPKDDDYALSLSDICMIRHLNELDQAGVGTIKLEGRMKRPGYVACVTKAYRAALDGASGKELDELVKSMLTLFDRGGERTGYFYGDNAVTDCVAKNETGKIEEKAAKDASGEEHRCVGAKLKLTKIKGEPAALEMSANGACVKVTGELCQTAQKPQDQARYASQLEKLGGTVFSALSTEILGDEDAFLSVSALNAMRREACEELTSALTLRRARPEIRIPKHERCGDTATSPVITACVRTYAQAYAAIKSGAQEIMLSPWDYSRVDMSECASINCKAKLLLELPAAVISHRECEAIETLLKTGAFDGAEANNIGQIELMQGLKVRIAGAVLNCSNIQTALTLTDMGCTRIMLSRELTRAQIRDMLMYTQTGIEVYGRAPLMQLRHCPIKEHEGCKNCNGNAGTLIDEAGRSFPLINTRQHDGCLVRMLNCVPTDITDQLDENIGLDCVRLTFTDEPDWLIENKILCIKRGMDGIKTSAEPGTTRGHWNRAVD